MEALEGFEVNATFLNPRDKLPFKAELNSILHKKDNVSNFFEKLKLSKFIVSNLTETKEERNAPPPFKTSTLQQVKFYFILIKSNDTNKLGSISQIRVFP